VPSLRASCAYARRPTGVAEYRNHSVALSKVLAAVAMTDTAGGRKDPKKIKAAEDRWRKHDRTGAAS